MTFLDQLRADTQAALSGFGDMSDKDEHPTRFRMEAVEVSYTVAAKASARGARGELLIQGPG
ncbi:hypothetical protein [Rhodovulum strictum]|uniref:Uncharacterized protein n=1 Tax=Rhodovulum strictum TaxID=58314 RepID=A0A844B199_9RHOB|nr:hypothetical protein [Rhodovulum strictum]MRH20146.1 hypothetical protein [Rhodovulum strictum]